jgi:hypothetical protein
MAGKQISTRELTRLLALRIELLEELLGDVGKGCHNALAGQISRTFDSGTDGRLYRQ